MKVPQVLNTFPMQTDFTQFTDALFLERVKSVQLFASLKHFPFLAGVTLSQGWAHYKQNDPTPYIWRKHC